jgi:uncharacterized protein YneF (UPF0154 family)
MAEVAKMDGPIGTGVEMTLIGVAVLMGIAYVSDRIYRRWLRENHPLAEHRARMVRMSTGYRRKRANLKEVVDIVADVLGEVARASSKGNAGASAADS